MRVTYNDEYKRKLKAGYIGCGGHSYRNIYPVFQYLPVDLKAVCDIDGEKAAHFARMFGAERSYTDRREMIKKEKLDAVFIVTNYDEMGNVRYPKLAAECLSAGLDVWIEKPPAGSLADIAIMRKAMKRSGKKLAIGFKTMFVPATVRARQISRAKEFGRITSVAIRYPQYVPTPEEFAYKGKDPAKLRRRVGFLDHICHPVSIMQALAGRAKDLHYVRSHDGSGIATFNMRSGAVVSMYFPRSQSASSYHERTEIIGEGANIIIDNNISLTYYKKVKDPGFRDYGRDGDFTGKMEDAPALWEPEFSMGNLANKNMFLLGYYNELKYFCDAALGGGRIETGGLDDAEEGVRIYEAFKKGPGRVIRI